MFHADKFMFYTNILFLLSIFVGEKGGNTEGVDSFVQYPSNTPIVQPQIIEMRMGLLML